MLISISTAWVPKPLMPIALFILDTLNNPWQFIRYFVGGVSAFIVDFSVYYVLVNFARVPASLTPWIGAPVAVTYAFLVQKYWTFRNKSFSRKQMLRYAFVLLENNIMTSLGLFLLVQVFNLDYRISKVLVMFVVVANNFPMFKLWVFK